MSTVFNAHKSEIRIRYRLDDRLTRRGDTKLGRPSMTQGDSKDTGQRILLKQWRRNPDVDDAELNEIWRQEIRQLHRLGGFPGAREFIVPLLDSGEDTESFYLVFSTGQRTPLAYILDSLPITHWLKDPKQTRNRLKLWSNLKRVALGLDILHTQGLLHRNIDQWAIFTSATEDIDFQLSGFEWSIRLSGDTNKKQTEKKQMHGSNIYSFLQDWQAFGQLAAELLGVNSKLFLHSKRKEDTRDPAHNLISAERDLLLTLLKADPLARLDGDLVAEKIDNILNRLEQIITKHESKLLLTCHLGLGSQLSTAIRNASNKEIEITDLESQIEFIKNDIAEEPLLVVINDPGTLGGKLFMLVGRTLNLRIQAYQHSVNKGAITSTWAIGYCQTSANQRPMQQFILGKKSLKGVTIDVLPLFEIKRNFAVLQSKGMRWDQQIEENKLENELNSSHTQYLSLILIQTLETLLISTRIWPVSLISSQETDGRFVINLKPRMDSEREKLSEILSLQPLAKRMVEEFSNDAYSTDKDWKLTDIGILGERDSETARWRFVEISSETQSEPYFVFDGEGPLPNFDNLFLRSGDYVGEDSLLKRRFRALRSLKEHAELLDMLDDPRLTVRKTHEVPINDDSYNLLDQSKQNALDEIWASLPLYLLQGPPGVGKTRLVKEIVSRKMREDSTARILLSAQSHHAVDHLLDEIQPGIENLDSSPIVVRSQRKDQEDPNSKYGLNQQAKSIVKKLAESELAKQLPQKLKNKLNSLQTTYREQSSSSAEQSSKRNDRPLEALILRSANLVFASTNSGDLEQLIEEKSQFDWSIIEEAGKATGPELISPLLLSHRRLMIGDHKQLPPFNADHLKNLLSDPQKIRQALDIGYSIIGRAFQETEMEDLIDESESLDSLTNACSRAAEVLMMFETMVEAEVSKPIKNIPNLPIARQLTYQHRMHPSIAKIVSKVFYKETLQSDPDCINRFSTTNPPYQSTGKFSNQSPVVFVNMPYVQSTIGKSNIEKSPRYYNEEEIEAVVEILKGIKPAKDHVKKTSIAVLSPYREQVKRIKQRLHEEENSALNHLADFIFEGNSDSPVGTVDSFQGSEADIVIISLVRNNHHNGSKGLGFLTDSRRMNVLLSRAKWKLIIVGSLEFLKMRLTPDTAIESHRLYFLFQLIQTIESLSQEKDAKGIPFASIITLNSNEG